MNGFRHHVTERGEGPALILLHGNGEDSGYFVHQLEDFAPYFHVYALDSRGHGQSPRGTAPFTIRQFSQDLLGFLDERGIEKTHILGFSDGANIAMVFALAHPERVDRLILNGGNLDPAGIVEPLRRSILRGYRTARLFAGVSGKARRRAELLGLMVNDPALTPADLEGITAPALVVAGDHDLIEDAHTRTIAAHLPHSRLAILPGDHCVANQNHEAFDRLALDFLTGGTGGD